MHGKHIFRARLANQVFEATSPLQRRAGPCNLSQQLSPTSVLSLRHRAEGPGQNSKQAIVAEENKHSSVSLTFEGSAFHASDIDHTVIATYQSRYPIARAAAENEELNKCDVAVSAGLCTRETRAGEECAAPQHSQVIIPSPNSLSTLSNTKDLPTGTSIQMAHTLMVPDPQITTTFCKGREAESVFQNILFRSCSNWAFGSEVCRFQGEKGLDYSSALFGSLVCLGKTHN